MNHFDKSTFGSQPRFAIQSWQYPRGSNFNSMVDYIEWMFERRSRLLVIRIDLSFRAESRGQFDAEYARDCFQRLMNNRRSNRIFGDLIGYLWSMEYGPQRGFHYHCILCFDGHKRQQGCSIAHLIGQYWRDEISDGTGSYHCCNDDIADLESQNYPVGIGLIHRNDTTLVENMVWMATYLIKQAQEDEPQLRAVLPESLKGFRSFGRGEIRFQ